jgi:hypothetical protein
MRDRSCRACTAAAGSERELSPCRQDKEKTTDAHGELEPELSVRRRTRFGLFGHVNVHPARIRLDSMDGVPHSPAQQQHGHGGPNDPQRLGGHLNTISSGAAASRWRTGRASSPAIRLHRRPGPPDRTSWREAPRERRRVMRDASRGMAAPTRGRPCRAR